QQSGPAPPRSHSYLAIVSVVGGHHVAAPAGFHRLADENKAATGVVRTCVCARHVPPGGVPRMLSGLDPWVVHAVRCTDDKDVHRENEVALERAVVTPGLTASGEPARTGVRAIAAITAVGPADAQASGQQ